MSNLTLMTQAGYDRLQQELDRLRGEASRDVAERLREARADGRDPLENAALRDVLEEQSVLDRRIGALETMLADAEIVAAPTDGTAGLGTTVRLRTTTGEVGEYQLVGDGEVDGSTSKISIRSPVGQALLGRRPGERIEVRVPRRTRRLELLSVRPVTMLREAA